ncbi:unnamed protein product [Nippostrongylus brasiliensis]|uniref:Secreted protein n=1 Tax=Nippostrongylus brasiliensis TaxID=27835 RepID=A0A0N4XL13_NIPBR|nr:unnamed protein product [Nippostrongylus brasiliensis]
MLPLSFPTSQRTVCYICISDSGCRCDICCLHWDSLCIFPRLRSGGPTRLASRSSCSRS